MKTKLNDRLFYFSVFLLFLSCQSEEADALEVSQDFIHIENAFDPEVQHKNKYEFEEAYNRFMSKTTIENGLFMTNISKGGEININEELYNYFNEHIQILNNSLKSKKGFLVNENGKYRYVPYELKERDLKRNFKDITLNSIHVEIGDFQGRVNLSTASDQALGESAMGILSNYSSSGNLGNHYQLSTDYRSGTFANNGYNYTYTIASSCTQCGNNQPANDFAYSTTYSPNGDSGNTFFQIRNASSNTLVTIKSTSKEATQSMRDEIN